MHANSCWEVGGHKERRSRSYGAAEAFFNFPHYQMYKELLKLLKDLGDRPSSQKRSEVARDLSNLCLADKESLSDAELATFFDILCALIGDVELEVRAKLAEQFAARDDVPRDLIMFLAGDEIVVAYPVLVFSELLDDEDLMRLVREKARDHHLALTQRYWLSPDVSEALVQTGDTSVVVSLLRNDNAELYPETEEGLVRQCRDRIEYREPLARREDLSPALAAKLYVWVGDVLRDHIIGRFNFEPDVIEDAISNVLSETMTQLANDVGDEKDGKNLAHKSQDSRASKLLLNYLQSGVANRFEQHFGSLTALPISAVRRALYHLGAEGLAIACKGAGFEQDVFAELLWRIHGNGAFSLFRASQKFRKAMKYFAFVDPAGARELLQVWRVAPPEAA